MLQPNGSKGKKPYDRSGNHPTQQEPDETNTHRDSPSRRRGIRMKDAMEHPTMYRLFNPAPTIISHGS